MKYLKQTVIVACSLLAILFISSFIFYNYSTGKCFDLKYFGFFLTTPQPIETSFFSFTSFISGLAIMAVLYSTTAFKYRFRLTIAPGNIKGWSFIIIILLGMGTLVSDYWFSTNHSTLACFADQTKWQLFFGAIFLMVIITWIFFSFIKPPKYGSLNYKKFFYEALHIILKNDKNELKVLANEIWRSADLLIGSYATLKQKNDQNSFYKHTHDLLLMLGNKNLCRTISLHSPGTAISIFRNIKDHPNAIDKLTYFSRNISAEAILNDDSILYQEDSGYESGWIGFSKPFSKTIYGDWHLVEELHRRGRSPFDLEYHDITGLEPKQFKKYCDLVEINLADILVRDKGRPHSTAIKTACDNIIHSLSSTYKINNSKEDVFNNTYFLKMDTAVDFIKNGIELLEEHNSYCSKLNFREYNYQFHDYHTIIAKMMFDIIAEASRVRDTQWTWTIHHNIVWTSFFEYNDSQAWRTILHRLRRLIYNEIVSMKRHPNYKNAKILALCLNVMGIRDIRHAKGLGYTKSWQALHVNVLNLVRQNYEKWANDYPDVAKECLVDTISYDAKNHKLTKTYSKRLDGVTPQEHLKLEVYAHTQDDNHVIQSHS